MDCTCVHDKEFFQIWKKDKEQITKKHFPLFFNSLRQNELFAQTFLFFFKCLYNAQKVNTYYSTCLRLI